MTAAAALALALSGCDGREPVRSEAPPPLPGSRAQEAPVRADARPGCASEFRLDLDAILTASEVNGLSEPQAIVAPGGLQLAYAPFDYEDYPVRGAWGAAGIVYAWRGADRAGAVGGVIWARQDVDRHPSGGGVLTQADQGAELRQTAASCAGAFVVRLDPDGTLRAGGAKAAALGPGG